MFLAAFFEEKLLRPTRSCETFNFDECLTNMCKKSRKKSPKHLLPTGSQQGPKILKKSTKIWIWTPGCPMECPRGTLDHPNGPPGYQNDSPGPPNGRFGHPNMTLSSTLPVLPVRQSCQSASPAHHQSPATLGAGGRGEA